MKESLAKIDSSLVFRETFNSFPDIARNGGTPTDITLANGVATFNGSSSKITYSAVRDVKAVRIRLKPSTTTQNIIKLSSSHSITVSAGTISATGFSSPTIYVNGAVSSTLTATNSEIIVTTATTISANDIQLGYVSSYYNGTMDLVEFYNATPTAQEVSLLYKNAYHRELPMSGSSYSTLFSFDTFRGSLSERMGKTLTATAVTVVKENCYSAYYDGADSMIDTGSDWIGTNPVTVCAWIKTYGNGEVGRGTILHNGKFWLFKDSGLFIGTDCFVLSSNLGSYKRSNNYSVVLNKWQFFAVLREAGGEATFYIGDLDTPPTVSTGTGISGTPTIGTTNVIIGNNNVQTWTYDGLIPYVNVKLGILTHEELVQQWSSTKRYIL